VSRVTARSIVLAPVEQPRLAPPVALPAISAPEYARRRDALRAAVGTEWVVVYGDREHFANLAYLCGFDPRFEEALLVLGGDRALLAVGNEGVAYAELTAPDVEIVLCPSLSLMGQDRRGGQTVPAFLRSAGLVDGDGVGVVGWKAFEAEEWESPRPAIAAPAFLVDALRDAVGAERVVDATGPMMRAEGGLRAGNSAEQLAAFEWAAARASACVSRVVTSARPGRTEHDAVAAMGYAGEPLSAHVMFSSGPEVAVGLRSPTSRVLELGDAVTTAVGFWGGLCARAGLLAHGPEDLGTVSEGYLEEMAIPYWRAVATWYETMRIGVSGGEIQDAVEEALGGAFAPALNPGHLIHLDEWLDSPVYPGSTETIASGMALQCDIIPDATRPGWAANCEDGIAIADERLRAELAERHPELWSRVLARRTFVVEQLRIELADEVLPLSSLPARFSPFWLSPEQALAFAG
jgi:Metallopeptidase family M24